MGGGVAGGSGGVRFEVNGDGLKAVSSYTLRKVFPPLLPLKKSALVSLSSSLPLSLPPSPPPFVFVLCLQHCHLNYSRCWCPKIHGEKKYKLVRTI